MSKVYIIANATRADFILHAATADKELAEAIFDKLKIKYHNTDYADDLTILVCDDADARSLLCDVNDSTVAETRNIITQEYPKNLLLSMAAMKLYANELPLENITDDILAGIEYSISTLTEQEQKVLRLKYQERKSFSQIGEHLGVSRQRASECERTALSKLLIPPRVTYIRYGKQGFEEIIAKRDEAALQQPTFEHQASIPLAELNLSARALNALQKRGYETVADIVSLTKKDISNIRNLGDGSIFEIASTLEKIGTCNTAWSLFLSKQKD